MNNPVYEHLADALDRLPNGYPRTSSGVELRILEKIFSPQEAGLAAQLTGAAEPMDEICQRTGTGPGEARRLLIDMARRGLVWHEERENRHFFRLAPFIVGIYEAQVERLDHELAHLVEQYFYEGAAVGIMALQPALHRVVPTQHSVKSEWILPYDDVRALILEAKVFHVEDCICRKEHGLLGFQCSFPLHGCLSFSNVERKPWPGDVTQQEALDLLDRCEEIGLVHTVNNVMQGMFYVCNCCGCCCGFLRLVNEAGIGNSVARANYYAVIEPELCANCGTCRERCQVHAISEGESFSVVDRDRCIGCGLCVTGCPNDVAHLERRPDAEQIHPPVNFAEWEHQRLINRGMAA